MTLEHGPEFDQVLTGATVTIRTKDGRVLQKRVDFPRGNPENRMSDAELRAKFVECAGARMDAAQIDRIIDTCMTLERLGDVGDLMGQLALAGSAATAAAS